jgi:hypothetical protein
LKIEIAEFKVQLPLPFSGRLQGGASRKCLLAPPRGRRLNGSLYYAFCDRRVAFLAALLGIVATAGCKRSSPTDLQNPASPPANPIFQDVTAASGLHAEYHNGEEAGYLTILESLGGGVALLDYDGDGLLDVYVPGGGYFEGQAIRGYPGKLFKNLGGFCFRDVTPEAGLDQPVFYSHGCAVADYDRDGWPDLLVTGYGRVALFHNEPDGKGGRHFVEVTRQVGLTDNLWSTSAAWVDLDGDGYPDLYICHYVDWSLTTNHPRCLDVDGKERDICPPGRFQALPHRLYRNQGGKAFQDVSREAGLRIEDPRKDFGRGLGVLAIDLNNDNLPDLYVANDESDNFLYLNRSKPGVIRLEEIGLSSGVARDHMGTANGSMGVAAADYDETGRPSLWVTNFEGELHALYHNESRGKHTFFRHVSQPSGIAALGMSYVGWGTGFLDLDHDGREHLLFVNGHPNHHPRGGGGRAQRPTLLRNLGQGRFEPMTEAGGPYFQAEHNARGLAFGDLDNDGRIDLVISQVNGPVTLLRNVVQTSYHWLGITLVGRGHRDVVGAKITLEVAGRRLTRFAQGGGSYLSACDSRILFGLGAAQQVGRLTVAWPGGKVEHWDGMAIDRYQRIVEGSGSK